ERPYGRIRAERQAPLWLSLTASIRRWKRELKLSSEPPALRCRICLVSCESGRQKTLPSKSIWSASLLIVRARIYLTRSALPFAARAAEFSLLPPTPRNSQQCCGRQFGNGTIKLCQQGGRKDSLTTFVMSPRISRP